MDWTNWQTKALTMIEKYGADMRILVTARGAYTPSTDTYATSATTSYPVKGLFTSLEDTDESGHETVIQNAIILVAAKNLPRIDDEADVKVFQGSNVYVPKKIDTIQPGAVAIIFRIRVK